jgi:hypothetical protein
MEQIWHDTLYTADMPWPENNMKQIWHDTHSIEQTWHKTLYRADLAQDPLWSRYGMASKLPGTDFLDKLPVIHLAKIFLACYATQSPTNPHAKASNSKNYVIDRAPYFTCLSLVTLHVIVSTVSVNYKRILPPQTTQRLLE